jgi:hypothetical protein
MLYIIASYVPVASWREKSMKPKVLLVGAALAVSGMLAGGLAVAPTASRAASAQPATATAMARLGSCPREIHALPAGAVARAADQARIQAPYLYRGFGPAVVELAWLAKFRLNVWAATPFNCSNQVRQRTVVVDLLFPKMLPSASLSEGAVLVSLFNTGYRVWKVAH